MNHADQKVFTDYMNTSTDKASPLEQPTKDCVNTLIFDLVGVVFYVDKRHALGQLGIWNIITYFLRNFSNPFDDVLKNLEQMRLDIPEEFQNQVKYKKYLLPNTIVNWQKGIVSTHDAIERLIAYLETLQTRKILKTNQDKEMMAKLLNFMVNPKTLLACIKPNKPMLEQVKRLKAQGKYKLFILSNLDPESYELFITTYPEFFSLFDGVVASGTIHLLKPFPEIFEYLLKTYRLKASDCLFIDDQEENLIAARALGIQTYLFENTKKFLTDFK